MMLRLNIPLHVPSKHIKAGHYNVSGCQRNMGMADQKSLETQFSIAICRPNWRQMAIESTVSSDFWSALFDCRLTHVRPKLYMFAGWVVVYIYSANN